MDDFELLAVAINEFDRVLANVGDAHWDQPSGCGDWTVRQLVNHVVAGNRMTVVLFEGGTREESLEPHAADLLGDDAIGAYTSGAADMVAAFHSEGSFERTFPHPAGEIAGRQAYEFRVADLALHAWDLAQPIRADDRLDPDLVEAVWTSMEPMASFIGVIGMFGDGPSGALPADASTQDRLLDLSGRRPRPTS